MKNISNSLNTRKRRKLERWIRRSNSTLRSKSLSPLPKVFSSMTELSNERTSSLSPSKFSSPSTNLLSESSPIKKKKKERKSQNNQSIVKKSSKNDSKKLTNLNFNEFSVKFQKKKRKKIS